ncbi:MAG: radical SAM protein [Lachnospiraceae bacterium]|nr:radical SAM protein [Lachnospiraceae bacterium]MCM1235362.1 radical SAM protein [Ruminococcus flavefaciens]
MKIGVIDIDGHNFPNIPLMKLSAWHKKNGDSVEWYNPMFCGKMDIVYMSKIFSFTDDYPFPVYADKIVKSGSGYAIKIVDGKEIYDKSADVNLPYEIEHIFPDYSLYPDLTKDTAYGFLTRGCPRNCDFCHVGIKEGKCSVKVADLSEFWNGQKNIVLCDPNLIACKDWKNLLQQLIDSRAYIDINQGIDIRLMTEEKAEIISRLKIKNIHFAWDRYAEKDVILPKLQMFKSITNWNFRKMTVFVLVNFDTTFEQDLERVYTLRDMGFNPYIMIYNKSEIERKSNIRKLQRWVNNRAIFRSVPTFDEYLKK